MTQLVGKIYLIGAGPGAPDLFTLRGAECLRRSNIVLYDYLVNPLILSHAARDAEFVCLGNHGGGRLMTQDEVNQRMVDAASGGLVVARLKGGDPALFGRLAEELSAIEAAGIPYEIVPGVTAASAASSSTGILLTHRDHASCVAMVAGREGDEKLGGDMDMNALAKFPGTLVVYMGVTSAPHWTAALIDHGMSAETPVAVVRRCSLPQQMTIVTTLGELAQVLAQQNVRPPAAIIVGQVVAARSRVDWFASRPLFGRTVLVTRPEHQADPICAEFSELGAAVLRQSVIEISPVETWTEVDEAIRDLDAQDTIVFSSANGVRCFFDRIHALQLDVRALQGARIAAIGPATADQLAHAGLQADVLPEQYRAEALAEALADDAAGRRFLLIRANRGREILADSLSSAGGHVKQIVVYQNKDVAAIEPTVAERLRSGKIDWTTATSSAIARSLIRLFGDDLRKTKLAAISPLTASVLEVAGFDVAATARQYTTDGLIDAVVEFESSGA